MFERCSGERRGRLQDSKLDCCTSFPISTIGAIIAPSLLLSHAGIALGLGIAEDYFETPQGGHTTAETSYWVARVIHYPPLSEADSYRQELADDAAKVKPPTAVSISAEWCGQL